MVDATQVRIYQARVMGPKNNLHNRTILTAVVLVALYATAFSSACDPGHDITFVNETNSVLTLYAGGYLEGDLASDEKRTMGFLEYEGTTRFEARDFSGVVRSSLDLSWGELKTRNWTIVFQDGR
jgi:hypothetical protein